ncbi:caspase family protein [Nocardia sp. NPDC059091]|uniref:caspase, EACC1-associated type n=1 Tax=Nocardia sp. NPDC059091 TaxID=3346724 RepID=UPI00368D1E93
MTDRLGWRALLVGVGEYDDENFHDVPAALNSVRAMKKVLTDATLCGWPENSVTVIENPRKAIDVGRPLADIAVAATGTLLVYFVGHGELNELNELCLVVGETELDHIEISSLEYAKVRSIINRSEAGAKIVILDCCNSGKAIEALSGNETQIANTTVIEGGYTLTAADYAAHVPSPQLADTQTSFTGTLIDIICHGVPEGGEFLKLSTIYETLSKRLGAAGLPKPNQRGTDTVENFEFSRNCAFAPQDDIREALQQVPSDSNEMEMLRVIHARFVGRNNEFARFAIALWRLIASATGKCYVGREWSTSSASISGKYVLGPIDDRIELDFALDAHCYSLAEGVDHRTMDRLIARMDHCHFGVLFTLSYVEDEVYKAIRDEREPVVVVCGKDVVEVLQAHGCADPADVEKWLAGKLVLDK